MERKYIVLKLKLTILYVYGSLARIPGAIWRSAQHRQITRGDRFDTRGHPWRARFCDLWKKRMTLKKKFFDFHQKFMTNGASTCRDTTQISKYHLLDLKTCQNTKDFALISGRVGEIICLCMLKHRLPRIFNFLFSVFSYDLENTNY